MNGDAFLPISRATLWIPDTGPDHDPGRPHLFVILTEQDVNGLVLTVPICTRGARSDDTCLISAGTHRRLVNESFVAYYLLNTFSAKAMVHQEQTAIIRYEGMLGEEMFARICNGIGTSPQAAPVHRKYFENFKNDGSSQSK